MQNVSPRFRQLSHYFVATFPSSREENRKDEIKKLTSEGKIPHEVELSKRPEISAKTRACKFQSVTYFYTFRPLPYDISHKFI